MSIRLTRGEVAELTGKKTGPAQARALDAMRIPFVVDGLGKICVSRQAMEERLSGAKPGHDPASEPDFSVFDRRAARHDRQA
ncbi:MAG: DUF4224 domain-containing protein [Betaproteobacteria bacterium]|jgi:hypothetical protein|nr:DUF4224 domain-containing protein [Betaproteobacteria bacterium]